MREERDKRHGERNGKIIDDSLLVVYSERT